MSTQNSTGIQTLLDAERDASQIIQQAREFRTKRVKEARDEARQEVTSYQRTKESSFKDFQAEV
jgi:V-type H+-transporting ATPase subunit G